MKRAMLTMLGLSLAAGLVFTSSEALAHGKNKGSQSLNRTDKKFIDETAQDGIAEVQLSQLASQKASSPQVKQVASQMYIEHSQANQQLKDLAMRKGVQPPTSLTKDDQKEYKKLRDLSGTDFDREYIGYLVKDHKSDIDLFQKEVKDGKDVDLKNWASDMVPKLQHHLTMVQNLQARISGKTSGG